MPLILEISFVLAYRAFEYELVIVFKVSLPFQKEREKRAFAAFK
jgi:hypothetical protein